MLHLGAKYEMSSIREDALQRLQRIFPRQLEEFMNHYTWPYLEDDMYSSDLQIAARDAIAVITLARVYDAPLLLPPAFYICAQLDTAILVDGYEDSDGKHHKLLPEDLKRCLRGQAELRKDALGQFRSLLTARSGEHCLLGIECKPRLQRMATTVLRALANQTTALITASWLEEWLENDENWTGLCKTCQNELIEGWERSRERTWDSLANYFQLDVEWPPLLLDPSRLPSDSPDLDPSDED